MEHTAPPSEATADAREAKYELASRLVDYMRLGEAIRILETLGDYKNSRALLKQIMEIKAYTDEMEEKRKAEDRRRIEERDRREAEQRKKRMLYAAAAGIAVVALFILIAR
ncbi:MAG: hypothetical protein IJ646_12675 [Clostridia bacterium]|nr:hypothetical protein [Clostridia bacterium]